VVFRFTSSWLRTRRYAADLQQYVLKHRLTMQHYGQGNLQKQEFKGEPGNA
jgi:hypothetical protein